MKRKMTAFFVALGAAATMIALVQSSSAQSNHEAKTRSAVRAVLDAQVAAWNRGDIEGFMEGYNKSPDTVFISGDTVTRGWTTVLDRYKRGYATRDKMGTLTFSELDIAPMNRETAVVIGRWQLTRAADTPHGRFTLIFRRTKEGWRIVHDHTSSAS